MPVYHQIGCAIIPLASLSFYILMAILQSEKMPFNCITKVLTINKCCCCLAPLLACAGRIMLFHVLFPPHSWSLGWFFKKQYCIAINNEEGKIHLDVWQHLCDTLYGSHIEQICPAEKRWQCFLLKHTINQLPETIEHFKLLFQ